MLKWHDCRARPDIPPLGGVEPVSARETQGATSQAALLDLDLDAQVPGSQQPQTRQGKHHTILFLLLRVMPPPLVLSLFTMHPNFSGGGGCAHVIKSI